MNLRHKLADLYEQHPDMWTQGAYARDTAGEAVEWYSKDATCFCIRGGINRMDEEWLARAQANAPFYTYIRSESTALSDVRTYGSGGHRLPEVYVKVRDVKAVIAKMTDDEDILLLDGDDGVRCTYFLLEQDGKRYLLLLTHDQAVEQFSKQKWLRDAIKADMN